MQLPHLVCLQAFWLSLVHANYPFIYSREHFLDVIASPSDRNTAARSGILVLLQPECELQLSVAQLNLDQHLVYLVHDYIRAKEHTWYEYREEDDLFLKYAKPDAPCLSAYYFMKGSSLDAPTDIWDEKADFRMWVWSQVQKRVTIINGYHQRIAIIQEPEAGGPEVPAEFLDAGRSRDILTYVSYTLKIVGGDFVKPVYATVVTENQGTINIQGAKRIDLAQLKLEEAETNEYWNTWIWSHGERYLRNIKQPLIVHNYTALGYQKTNIPPELYQVVAKFYNVAKENRNTEEFYRGNAVLESNTEEKKPTMVFLTDDVMDQMECIIQPQLEQWCKCKLKRTAIYGVREYYEGNVLRNHVDRVDTHVISVILQIDQDLGGKEDWLLEVINYEGKRKYVKLLPGEMLMYESAKLIHGRPQVFKGKSFANAFMHFAPVTDWDYSFDGRHFVSEIHNVYEPLDNLYTKLAVEKNLFQRKDEL